MILVNSIVSGNIGDADFINNGYALEVSNLISVANINLAPLGNYGGPTQTMPPLANSPAIDAGSDSVTNFLSTDQRGLPRLSGLHVDVGAVEAQWAPAGNPPLLTSPSPAANGRVAFGFTSVSNTDFAVLATTNLALPLGQWSILGETIQNAPGQYEFTDSAATNFPLRFYDVVSP